MNRTENARARMRDTLQHAQAERRDAIEKARRDLPSYTDDELEEITGRFAALSAEAAASATADALTHRRHSRPDSDEPEGMSQPPLARRFTRAGKVAAAATTIGSTLVTLAHWVLHWF